MKIIQSETNIGLVRKRNEDVSLSIVHPKNNSIHLLLVADGMGGKEHGDIAAKYVASNIEKWFKRKAISAFSDMDLLEDQVINFIDKINNDLIEKIGEGVSGTTLSMGIVTKKKTLVINVGDSRGYIYKNKKLIQVTEDASDVWFYYKYGAVKKDDLRYFYNNNIITSCIGLSYDFCHIDVTIIDNDYDMLMFFTDGVTDLITDRKIKKIIENTKRSKILLSIINEAVYIEQNLHIPLRLKRKKYSKYILPFHGRDNASGAIYIK